MFWLLKLETIEKGSIYIVRRAKARSSSLRIPSFCSLIASASARILAASRFSPLSSAFAARSICSPRSFLTAFLRSSSARRCSSSASFACSSAILACSSASRFSASFRLWLMIRNAARAEAAASVTAPIPIARRIFRCRARRLRSSKPSPSIGARMRSFSLFSLLMHFAGVAARTSPASGSSSVFAPSAFSIKRIISGKLSSGSPSTSTVSTRS